MFPIAIELIDDAIAAVGPDGLEIQSSPGFALLDGKDLVVGRAARAVARLKPRFVDNRFWDRLDSSPMPRPFPRALTRADVAHTHLEQFWREIDGAVGGSDATPSVLLAVPGCYSPEQLGLALGIARACAMPVVGIVDAAVAAVSGASVGGRVLHLDLLLHRAVWTEITFDGALQRRRVEVLADSGLAAVRNQWARYIAQVMVRQTRFDPLHHGDAEQSLFDQLPQWLGELANDSRTEVSLASGDKLYRVEIVADSSRNVATTVLGPVIEVGRTLAAEGDLPVLVVSSRAATLPGLLQGLARLPQRGVRIAPRGSAAAGALVHAERIASPGPDLPLVTRLPVEIEAQVEIEVGAIPLHRIEAPRSADAPTHLLLGSSAHPITAEPLWLGSALPEPGRGLVVAERLPGLSRRHCSVQRLEDGVVVEDHSSYGTFVNDRRIEGRTIVAVGDRLRVGSPGIELLLIRVETDV